MMMIVCVIEKNDIFREKFHLPREQTKITMKIDDRRENVAFKPSTKFISWFFLATKLI